jgi:hypothetical protein
MGPYQKQNVLRFYSVLASLYSMPFYGSECWTLTKDQKRRMKGAEMRRLRAVVGCRMMDHKWDADIRE